MAALVPKPRVNLTRFHGVFAPNRQLGTAGLIGKGCLCFSFTIIVIDQKNKVRLDPHNPVYLSRK